MATSFAPLALKVENASTTKKAIFKETPQFESTMDYTKFSLLKCNRNIDREHVERLKKEILNNNLCAFHPVMVDKFGRLWDGQHRGTACIELGLPIYYVVHPFESLEILPILNSTSKVWKTEDYIRFFAQNGNHRYAEYDSYCKKAKKACKDLTTSSLHAMYFKADAPSATLKDSTNNYSKARNILLNENRDELLKWLSFAVKHGVSVKSSHFVYAFKDFIVGKNEYDIEDTIFKIHAEQKSWVGTGKKFFATAINNCYQSVVRYNKVG